VPTIRSARLGLAAVVVAMLVAAACSGDGDDDTTSSTLSPTTTAVSNANLVRFDATIQQELADVGCYTGDIDGILGPQSDAAIVAFQSASGLTVDGELGAETEAALAQAVSRGEAVCSTTDPTAAPPTTTSSTTPTTPTAPCTATALARALPPGTQIQSYACSDGYAGVAFASAGAPGTALLEANGPIWTDLGTSVCGGASAGYPPPVLEIACPA
jgi:peptidoglycan hydrolase-like protein with peptidoglycan-binding domain